MACRRRADLNVLINTYDNTLILGVKMQQKFSEILFLFLLPDHLLYGMACHVVTVSNGIGRGAPARMELLPHPYGVRLLLLCSSLVLTFSTTAFIDLAISLLRSAKASLIAATTSRYVFPVTGFVMTDSPVAAGAYSS